MLKQIISRSLLAILVIIFLVVGNACYWVFSDIQTRCSEKIAEGKSTSIYEKASILSLHLGICTVGAFYCPDAAYANFKMLVTSKDTVYLHSDKWITPKVKARLDNQPWGRMAWNGNIDYAFRSPEKAGAILLNWCILGEQVIDGKLCYTAECDYTWKVPSRTTFKLTDNISIVLYEQLFFELEKSGILHPFKLICYDEK